MNKGYCEAIPQSGYLAKDGYYITSTGEKVILEPSDIIGVPKMDIIELVIPNGVKEVDCYENKLTELIIPDSAEWIHCKFNNLTELIIPDNCKVWCDPSCLVITRTMYNRNIRLKNILK